MNMPDRLKISSCIDGQRHNRNRGFTLIELMVGITLLVVLMAGFVPVYAHGLAQSSAARYKSLATNIAREKIEQIRQLDYREIQEEIDPDTGEPTDDPRNLSNRFDDSVTIPERQMTFSIDYVVTSEVLPGQAIKSVEVTVSWTAPPEPVSPAVVKTMVAQQYLGPRAASLVVTPKQSDNIDPAAVTPFPLLYSDGTLTQVQYHLAQSDWFMAYDSLAPPLPTANDISLETYFRDEAGGRVNETVIDNTALTYSTDGTPATVDDIWFQYSFDASVIPDGYWDFCATMLNTFDEPGNTWVLRVRVEKGAPGPPTNFNADSTSSETVVLSWEPATERDRAYYILMRKEWTWFGSWSCTRAWEQVEVDPDPAYPSLPADTLPPTATSFTDIGSLDTSDPYDPSLDEAPCGSAAAPRWYEYRIYGVDTGGRFDVASAPVAWVYIPPATSTPKVVVPDVTGLLLDGTLPDHSDGAKATLTAAGLGWSVTETVDDTVAPGTVLSQNPAAGSEVEEDSIVALVVAIASPTPEVPYQVTLTTKEKTSRTIVVLYEDNTTVYTGSIVKNSDIVLSLVNGHYTVRLNTALGAQLADFFVNGADLDVTIPEAG